jgi:predicted kinase
VSTVYLLCGKTGSGKSTYAAQLQQERRALSLSLDELMLPLFGAALPRPEFEQRLAACKEYLLSITERLLALDVDVVLDWGFWGKAERLATRERVTARGGRCELIYFAVPDALILERLRRRNARLPDHTYEISETMFEELSRYFEPPGPDETYALVTHDRVAGTRAPSPSSSAR